MSTAAFISWTEGNETLSARWQSEGGVSPPQRVVVADDGISADDAYRLACGGTSILWRGDFQNARQLLQAMARRIDRKRRHKEKESKPIDVAEFHLYRQTRLQRVRTLGMLLLPFDDEYRIPLRRAPDVRSACMETYGPASGPFVTSLRELQGLIGAHEWRKTGVVVPELEERIYPHYGVFAPIRGEYVGLVASTPLPAGCSTAFDIGTGTGVLAAVLAKRGVLRICATDNDPRALACAADNMERLGLAGQVEVTKADLFPPGRASLVVCNPPWLPGRAASSLERAVYDPDSRMLYGFIEGLARHLEPGGEGWMILSDLAEHLGLRSRTELLGAVDSAGLKIVGRFDARPNHPRTADNTDPLHVARAAELTSLWRLAMR